MPLKAIEFNHEGRTIQAKVAYNFNHLSDAVLIMPINSLQELGDNILLIKEDNYWKTSSPLRKQYPSLFNHIVGCVDRELKLEECINNLLFARRALS